MRSSIEEISQRKLDSLESEEKFRQLFEQMSAGFALHEVVYNEKGRAIDYRFLEVNPSFERLTGLRAMDLLGRTVREVMPDTEEYWIEAFCSVAETGQPIEYENYSTALGRYYHARAYRPIKGHFAVIFEDVTEHREHQKRLNEAKEKAEEANRLKSAFLANLSHEIRTPLNGILGFLHLMRDCELSAEENAHYAGIVEQSAQRLMDTLGNIIEISKIESGNIEINTGPVRPVELIKRLASHFRSEAQKRNLRFASSSESLHPSFVFHSDAGKLEIILTQILKNAIQFTYKGGEVEICLDWDGNDLCFSVRDTGAGLDEEEQAKVFEPFIKGRSDLSKVSGGTGVGLAIARAYAKALNGSLTVQSRVGQGSTFTLRVPAW